MSTSDTGNSHFVKITPDSLSLEEVTEFVKDPSAGGISVFMGEYVPQLMTLHAV